MQKISRGLSLAIALVSFTASAQMLSDSAPPQHRLVQRHTFALRYNPLGLIYDGRIMYRLRLYESQSVALRDNFLGFGLAPTASPAFLRIGPYVEIAPATFATLWASYTFVQYFGSFSLMQSFKDRTSNYSDTTISALGKLPAGDPARNYTGNGGELTLGLDLQFKVGPMVIRARSRLVRPDMNLRAGDTVFYDQLYDVLQPNKGLMFTTDGDLLYTRMEGRLILGARYTGTVPLYGAEHGSSAGAASNTLHRVGPFLGYTFFNKDGAGFNSPTVFLLIQWWLANPNRTGQDVSQALPLIGAGFQFTGDIIDIGKKAEPPPAPVVQEAPDKPE